MTLFFKLAYKPFFDKWKSNKKKSSIVDSLVAFVNQEFPDLIGKMSQKARFEFIELVKLLVLSHRHNKNDDFLKDPLVDFATVRDTMYKYSKQAQDNFFSISTFAFLFAWFAASPQGKAFAEEKFGENSDSRHILRMTNDVALLGQEAAASINGLVDPDRSSLDTPKGVSLLDVNGRKQMADLLSLYLSQSRTRWEH